MRLLDKLFGRKSIPAVAAPTIPVSATIPTTTEAALETMKNDEQKKSAVLGCILGQAIGDALGHPIEFSGGFGKVVPPLLMGGQFTDDTQMMDAIARALLKTPPHLHPLEDFMTTLGEEFAYWQRHPLGGSHRAPGGACSGACSALNRGVHWTKSGGLSAKGNGTAMRASVVGAYYHRNLQLAWQVGCMTAIPTHNNLESILMAGTVALLCACGINGIPLAKAIALVLENIADFENTVPVWPQQVKLGSNHSDQNPWYAAAWIGQAYAMGRVPSTESDFKRVNGNDFATVPATAAAVYYNAHYSNFRDVVLNCISNTGDCDTTGAIAGAIAGSRFTAQFIPLEWRQNVELSDYFHELAGKVWEASRQVTDADTLVELTRT